MTDNGGSAGEGWSSASFDAGCLTASPDAPSCHVEPAETSTYAVGHRAVRGAPAALRAVGPAQILRQAQDDRQPGFCGCRVFVSVIWRRMPCCAARCPSCHVEPAETSTYAVGHRAVRRARAASEPSGQRRSFGRLRMTDNEGSAGKVGRQGHWRRSPRVQTAASYARDFVMFPSRHNDGARR
jgi:hypothetical protein